MNYLLKLALGASLIFAANLSYSVKAESQKVITLRSHIETALNSQNKELLKDLFVKPSQSKMLKKYKSFLAVFPNTTWKIKRIKEISPETIYIDIQTKGVKDNSKENYSLEASHIAKLELLNNKIISHNIISSQSIIKPDNSELTLSVNIPNNVLTGTKYDFDVILQEPLKDMIIAGGVLPITSDEVNQQISPEIPLEPLGGGGLFKTIKAPLNPGSQNWAALIVHPKGLISITKLVNVVSDASDIHF